MLYLREQRNWRRRKIGRKKNLPNLPQKIGRAGNSRMADLKVGEDKRIEVYLSYGLKV